MIARELPAWLREGVRAADHSTGRSGIVMFVGDWEDPADCRMYRGVAFLRPVTGGREWMTRVGDLRLAGLESDW
ncbi:hypothetical protein ACWGCW_15915 [Streptomyces sp. NPDC054933]